MDDAELRKEAERIAAWDLTVTRAQRRDAIERLAVGYAHGKEQAITALNVRIGQAERECANLREMNAALQECCNRKARIEKELRAALDENERLRKRLAAAGEAESFDALTARLYAGHLTPVEFKARLIALRDAGRLEL